MGWNTALDGAGNTYYWHSDTGASQYEKPADFDPSSAISSGAYSQYAHNYPSSSSSLALSSSSSRDRCGVRCTASYGYDDSIGLQYSRPTSSSYNDVQEQGADAPASDAVLRFWKENDVKVYGGSPPPFLTFEEAGLPAPIMDAIHRAGFKSPSVIQAQTWPAAMAKRDVIGVAKTGSGKTLGFLVPGFLLIQATRPNAQLGPTLLCLAPTRELAMQIEVECQKFGSPLGIHSVCCYGGQGKGSQLSKLRQGCQVVIGTPGRINDFLETQQIRFGQVSYLVMDEADRMLDMGFEPQIRKIVLAVPPQRQTLFYTATWPKAVRRLAYEFLRSPIQVEVGDINSLNANKDITQYVHFTRSQQDKQDMLRNIFCSLEAGSRTLIFTSTKRMADQLGMMLQRMIGCGIIHGDKDQREREAVLSDFKSGRRPVMIATDVAARGIDVKEVKAVINYDFPGNIEDYIHRIGRTGRAGAKGEAHTFMDAGKDGKYARALADIMLKAGQKIPHRLAQLGGIRHNYDPYDERDALQPHPLGGMLTLQAAQLAASITSSMPTREECGDFKRGLCNRGARCKFSHGGGGSYGGSYNYGGGCGGFGAPTAGAPPLSTHSFAGGYAHDSSSAYRRERDYDRDYDRRRRDGSRSPRRRRSRSRD
eukprot:scaffold167361_cov30-Tisochrysis_lutea.AAC.3